LPALAFALGMYLPLSVNTPVLAGGLIAHWVGQGGTEKQQTKRKDKGTLMASGFVAGGAIMGVLAALAKFAGIKATGNQEWSVAGALGLNNWAEHMELSAVVTLIVFCLLGYYLYKSARNAG